MSLLPTDQQLALRERVRHFAQSEVAPRISEVTETERFPRDLYQRCGELGFWRLNVPPENGGEGGGLTEACIVMEELARVSPALSLSVEIGIVSLPMLLTTGAARYAEAVMSGDLVIAAGSTDPKGQNNSAEWDIFAREEGDDYLLNGTRLFVTNAQECDLFSVSGLDESRRMRKFYVPVREVEGVTIKPAHGKYGMAGSGSGTIKLTNCRIPKGLSATFAIGTSAYYYYVYCLCAAEALGCMQGAFDLTIERVKSRRSNFTPLAELQAIAHKVSRLALRIEMARSLVYDAATMYDAALADGSTEALEAWSLKAEAAKVCVSEIANDVTTACVVLHGGLGYHDRRIHHFAGDALCYRIMDMTNEIHLDNVARTLGLLQGAGA
jgi:alkylation response protein AidB-like acyl-CoA dehydrogenase